MYNGVRDLMIQIIGQYSPLDNCFSMGHLKKGKQATATILSQFKVRVKYSTSGSFYSESVSSMVYEGT